VIATLAFALALNTAAEAPPLTDAELKLQIDKLRAPDGKTRLDAANWIASQPPQAMPVLAKQLLAPRTSKPDTLRRLFLEIWAQVPNWKGSDPMWIMKPEPVWVAPPRVPGQPRPKKPPPHDPEKVDWIAALNELDLNKPELVVPEPPPPPPKKGQKPPAEPPPEPPAPPTVEELTVARGEALEVVALMRGIAASKRLDAVDPIFNMAFELEGAFRDECGKQIRSMESYAVPALIRLMHQKGTKEKPTFKQRRYASYQLDRMDRARPQKAIGAAPDDRVKASIVHQYGEERALDAVDAILEQVDATSHRVRKEARWAWLRYVTGPAPPPAPKRKRKLAGGKEETKEKADYLTYREIAELALQKKLTEVNGVSPDPKRKAKDLTDELFAHYDQQRAAVWDAQFEEGRKKEQAGDWKGAVEIYGYILSFDPSYARRAEMAGAYAKLGDQLRKEGKTAQALGWYRQAVDLDPEGPQAAYAGARVAMLDGEQSLALGHGDVGLFKRALQLDPSLKEAREGLARAEALRGRRRWLEVGEALGGIIALAFGLWVLWKRADRRVPPISQS
jgi:tetratricopeptide (TPR) repeat protein